MKPTKIVRLNPAQMAAVLSRQKNKHFEWSRGAGKSTILGWYVKEAVRTMPRATGILVGATYMQMLSRTLPSTKEGLEMFGFYENIDYVIGRSGKSLGFDMPFQSPNSWRNMIHFRNGFVLAMVSLDMPDSGRGLNSYIVIGDEAALLDPERLFNNVQTTNRATKPQFEKNPLLNAEIYASSTPLTKTGKWFIKAEQLAKQNPDDYVFIKANAYVNRANLSLDWFKRMKEKAISKMHYEAEILNIRPKDVTNGFYPQLEPAIHYYEDSYNETYLLDLNLNKIRPAHFNCRQDKDLNPDKPLIVSVDWGANINSMVVTQHINNELRFLKDFWVKSPKILDDLFNEEFLPYYKYHKTKVIHFYYDRNGNTRVANSKMTYAEQAIKIMRDAGWRVIVKTPRSLDPAHNDKFLLINYLLKYDGRNNLPRIRINKYNCQSLITSLEYAEAKDGRKGIEKDKSSERNKNIPQEEATHLSDAFDLPIYWLFKDKLNTKAVDPIVPIVGGLI